MLADAVDRDPAVETRGQTGGPTNQVDPAAIDVTVKPGENLLSKANSLLRAGKCVQLGSLASTESVPATTRMPLGLMAAKCHRRAGQTTEALAIYQRVAATKTRSGRTALFEIAKLQSVRNEHRTAKLTLMKYLTDYPRGSHAAAVEFRICRYMLKDGNGGAAKRCLRRYRELFPEHSSMPVAAYLLGTIARSAGEWDRASVLFREYVQLAPGGRHAEGSAYYRIEALSRTNSEHLGRAIQEYLRVHPGGRHATVVRQMAKG